MKKKFLLVLIFAFLSGCTRETTAEIPFVEYKRVEVKPYEIEKSYAGFIDRGFDVELSFGLNGTIDTIYYLEGDFVKKGTVIARLDNKEYEFGIERAQNELEDAIVKYNRAKSYYERITKLHDAGGISFNDWESAQTNLKSSMNQIEILKDSLEIAKDKYKFASIVAPSDGYIIKSYKDNGQFSSAGERVILFQGKGGLEARVFVSQSEINKINKGDEVVLKSDAILGKTYRGYVKTKTNTSINEGSYRVTISIPNNYDELLDGMSVSVSVLNKNKQKGIFLPINSIVSDGDKSYVYLFCTKDGKLGYAKKQEVVTGEVKGEEILIKQGLQEGSLVIVKGVEKIMDNSKVEVEDESY